MSLSPERIAELQAIASNINLLTQSEKNAFNGYYNPDIMVVGCQDAPTANVDVSELAEQCEGLTYEEIEFLENELDNEQNPRLHIGIKPGAAPSGNPSGNK